MSALTSKFLVQPSNTKCGGLETACKDFAPNVPIFRQNVRANLANLVQDLLWRVSLRFSNEDIQTVDEGLASLGDRQDLNVSVPGSRCCSKCWMRGGKQKDLFLHKI